MKLNSRTKLAMKHSILLTATLACILAGCTKEISNPVSGERQAQVKATIEGQTKITLTDDAVNKKSTIGWKNGDVIDVLYKDGGYSLKPFTTTGDGNFTGTVSGTESGDVAYVAIYPSNIVKSIYASTGKESIHLNLPEVINGDGADAIPMIAHTLKANFDGTYAFKQAGSVLRFTFSNIPAGAKQLVITSEGSDLAGTYYTSYDATNNIFTYTEGTSEDGAQKTVTYNFTRNADGTNVFYLPFGIATPWFYFNFTFLDENGDQICTKKTTLTGITDTKTERGKMYRFKLNCRTFTGYPTSVLTLTKDNMPTAATTELPGYAFTAGGYDFYAFQIKQDGSDIRFYNSVSAKLYNKTSLGVIQKIIFRKGATTMYYGSFSVYAGTAQDPSSTKISASNAVADASAGYSEVTYDFSGGSYDYFSIVSDSAYYNYVGSIEITYAP